jgi:2-amino-4-hydroxy-6-hydroxymethyldihydropteridine diphosphokinase
LSAGTVYLGLGSNLGDRFAYLQAAARALAADRRFTLLRTSSVYASRAVGENAGGEFLNSAVAGLWDGTPDELLEMCQAIELEQGRVRPYPQAPRTLDIDILWWEGLELNTPHLRVPHEHLRERAFALVPLLEIAAHLQDPGTGAPLSASLTTNLLEQGIETVGRPDLWTEPARV